MSNQGPKIMLDPGHGGMDPGAVAYGLKEKHMALTIAKQIRYLLLQNYQVQVRMTREDDVFVELSERAKMANKWGAEYFLSIHVNAGGGTGFESYIHESRWSETVRLQQTIHPHIVEQLNVRDRGTKSANFAVLRETKMSALLTENLFLDHMQDVEKLRDESFLHEVAQGHVNGLQKAFNLQRVTEPSPKEDKPSAAPDTDPSGNGLYRVLIDDEQVGAFKKSDNIVRQVEQHLGKADEITVQKV